MSRASRGRLDRPLSLRDVAGKEASIVVVVGCEGGASLLVPGGGGSCEVCCDGVASTSAIVGLGRCAEHLCTLLFRLSTHKLSNDANPIKRFATDRKGGR